MRTRNIVGATVVAAFLLLAVATPQPAYAWGGSDGGCGPYVVRWGDTLGSIAAQHGTTISALRQANPNLGYWLYAGQTITIPCGYQDGGCGYQGGGCGYQDSGWGYGYQGYQDGGCGYQGGGCGYQDGGWGYGYQGYQDGGYQGHGWQDGGCGYQSSGCGYQDSGWGYGQGYGNTYVVRRGDTLAKIAARFGTTWYHLCQLNGLWNPNLIYAGQVLTVR